MKQLAEAIDKEARRPGKRSDRMALARDCDRLYCSVRAQVTATNVAVLRAALLGCAESGYERIASRRDSADASYAIGRLLSLWEAQTYDYSNRKRVERYEKKIKRLRRRYPDVEAVDAPPAPPK
jgi:hypothetical protein